MLMKRCGNTPFQATAGRAYRDEVVPFGEGVDAQVPGEHKCRAVENWRAGAWLGKDNAADGHLAGCGNGGLKARTVKGRAPGNAH